MSQHVKNVSPSTKDPASESNECLKSVAVSEATNLSSSYDSQSTDSQIVDPGITEDKPSLFTLEDEKKFSSEIDKETIAAVKEVAARQLQSINEDQSVVPQGLRMKVARVSESLSVLKTYKTHLESSLPRDVTVAASSIDLLDLKTPSSVDIKSLRHTKIVAEDLLRQLEVCKGDGMDVSDISESVSIAVEFINEMGPELRQVMETLSTEQDLQQDVEQIQLIVDLPYETLEAMCSV